jgi:hypothetical protein
MSKSQPAQPWTPPAPPPRAKRIVRVVRESFRRVFHPTIEELEAAIDSVSEQAEGYRWLDVKAVEDFYGARIEAALGVAITVTHVAERRSDGARLLAIATSQIGPTYIALEAESPGRGETVPGVKAGRH